MGRTYLAETAVQQYIDNLLSPQDTAVGLIIGQVMIAACLVDQMGKMRLVKVSG